MAPAQRPPHGSGRPKAKTPAERAEEAADVQRRLKREAAERRAKADAATKADPATARAAQQR